jgi:RsiW-degrading membrane proteinase PrsW (M82 family)
MNQLLLLIGVSLAPGIYLSVVIYGKDQYDREPKRILLTAFLLGCLSIVPAVVVENYWTNIGFGVSESFWWTMFHAFVMVGFTEEFFKFLMLRFHAYRHKEFNEPFDGIVYASFVALGFATLENLLYVLQGGLSVGIMRMFTAVPAHFAFGVIMGYYVGKSKFPGANKTACLLQGLLYASFMHGAYDFFIMQKNFPALGIFTIGILIMAWRISKRSIEELHADSVFRFHNPPGEA